MKRIFLLFLIALFAVAPAGLARAESGEMKLPAYQRQVLKNGLTVIMMEKHNLPLVSLHVLIKAGSVADPPGKEGLASITADLLRKGTKRRNADQISAELDFLGGTLGSSTIDDYAEIRAEFLTRHLEQGLDILSDLLKGPIFPKDQVESMVSDVADGIKSSKDEAADVIDAYYDRMLYGTHPYGRPTAGDERSVATITQADVAAFYKAHYSPSNTILAVVGDFKSAELLPRLVARFEAWPDRKVAAVAVPDPAPVHGRKLLLVDKPDATQTYFQFGNVGISRTSPDRVQINVVNTIFGGRFTSRLNTALRINSGLTYGASSFFGQRLARGPYGIYSYTRNETTEKALVMALDVLKKLRAEGVTEQELASARSYIKGQYPPDLETTDQLARVIARLEFYGLDKHDVDDYFAHLDAMTLADATRIIKTYFPEEDLIFVLIGKASEIQEVARKLVPDFTTKSISEPGF